MSDLVKVDAEAFASAFGEGELDKGLRELHYGTHARQALASVRRAEAARLMERLRPAPIEGLGQCSMIVDPAEFHFFGVRYGYDCWEDKQFVKEFKRDNPSCVVKQNPRKTTILVP